MSKQVLISLARCGGGLLGSRGRRSGLFLVHSVARGLACGFALLFSIHSACGQTDPAAQAAALMAEGKFHEAEAAWRQILEKYPKNAAVHGGLAVSLAQQGQMVAAIAEYRRSLLLDPHQPDMDFNLGLAEFKQGDFQAGAAAFVAFSKARPADPRIPLLLGMSYYGLHDYAKAMPFLQKAVASDGSNLELRTVLAQNCLWAKQFDCAMTEFQSILAANPDAVQAHMLLAQALDGDDKTADAVKELQEAEHLSPQEPMLHFELGYLYYRQRNYDEAKRELELEVKNNPGYGQSYLYLGDIALHTDHAAEAEPLLKKAVMEDESRLGYFDLGSLYADAGRKEEAVAALERAVRLDPTQPDAHYRLARLYSAMGEKEKAGREFAKTKELHSKKDDSLIDKVSGPQGP